jgi:hypothetical protein
MRRRELQSKIPIAALLLLVLGGLVGDPDISTTASLALNDSHAEPDRSRTPLRNFTSALKLTTVGR